MVKDKLVAKAVVDARFLSRKGGKVTPSQLLTLLGLESRRPGIARVGSHVGAQQRAIEYGANKLMAVIHIAVERMGASFSIEARVVGYDRIWFDMGIVFYFM